MSSSDSADRSGETAGWGSFTERNLPFETDLISPAVEVVTILQKLAAERNGAQQQIQEARESQLQVLAQQAVFVTQLAKALDWYEPEFEAHSLQKVHRHLRVVKDQMLDTLTKAGLEILVPLGAPFEHVADQVHVTGWRHHAEYQTEQVAEVVEPIVRYQNRLVRAGRVVMGAPHTDAPSQPATETQD